MKNNKLYIIIIVALVVFSLTVVINSQTNLRKENTKFSHNKPCVNCNENQGRITGIESDNVFLNLNKEIISYDNNPSTLKKILNRDSIYLIFRYPLSYCGDCIDEICAKLEQLKDSIPCVNIIIIASGGTVREMKVKMRPYKSCIFNVYE